MADEYQSSDQVKTVTNRLLGSNVIERTLTMGELTNVSDNYWYGSVELDLEEFNLNTLVPEFEVTMWRAVRVNGPEPGEYIYYNTHDKLPITEMVTSGASENIGLVQRTVRPYIYYESSGGVKDGVVYTSSRLRIEYWERSFSGFQQNPKFYVKIKGSDSITA